MTLVDTNRGKTDVPPSDDGVTGVTVDTSGSRDVVHVGFNQSFPDAPTGSPLRNPIVMVATCADGGATFPPPVNLNSVAAYGGTPETSPTTGIANVVVQRSTDDGHTWSEPLAINDESLTQTQDNFAGLAQFSALPANKSSTWPRVAAVFGGLVVAGIIILLVVTQMGRRRDDPTSSTAGSRQPVSAP